MTDRRKNTVIPLQPDKEVGYKRPPLHSRFKPGQSGNPSGRAKGSQNLKTLFQKILKEEVSLREGSDVRKVSKAEAIMRGLVVGALKGDTRSTVTLFRLAEQTGEEIDVVPVEIICGDENLILAVFSVRKRDGALRIFQLESLKEWGGTASLDDELTYSN